MAEVHVLPRDGKWAVELDGAQQALYATEDEAVEAGRNLARVSSADFVLHPHDAPVTERDLYQGGGSRAGGGSRS